MTAIPSLASPTRDAIYRAYEERAGDGWRPHLGASIIGDECERKLWFTFRWVTKAKHSGRVLRLFQTGHLEEDRLIDDLRAIGVQVHHYDIETGQQHAVKACRDHFGGSMDAVVVGLPEAPQALHVAEFKTHNSKSFKALQAKGVQASKPMHHAQMQVYMHLGHIDRAVYIAVCKETDEIYTERVRPDAALAIRLLEKAERIIAAPRPPAGISDDPDHWQCRFCDHRPVCHGQAAAARNCRTCYASTPVEDGAWHCAAHDKPLTRDEQKAGCGGHRFLVDLVPGEQVDAADDGAWIEYRMPDGTSWRDVGPAA